MRIGEVLTITDSSACYTASLSEQLQKYTNSTTEKQISNTTTESIIPDKNQSVMKAPYNKLKQHYIQDLDIGEYTAKPKLFELQTIEASEIAEILSALQSRSAVFVLSLGDTFIPIVQAISESRGQLFADESQDARQQIATKSQEQSAQEQNSSTGDSSYSLDAYVEYILATVLPIKMSNVSLSLQQAFRANSYIADCKQIELQIQHYISHNQQQGQICISVIDIDVPVKQLQLPTLRVLTGLQMSDQLLNVFIFHNEKLFTQFFQQYRMVLPIQPVQVFSLNSLSDAFAGHFDAVQQAVSDCSLSQLYNNILQHKSKNSAGFLIITAFLQLLQHKMTELSGASLINDVTAGQQHCVFSSEIEQAVREILTHKRQILQVRGTLISQEIGQLNNEEQSLAARIGVKLIEIAQNGGFFVKMKYSEIVQVLNENQV